MIWQIEWWILVFDYTLSNYNHNDKSIHKTTFTMNIGIKPKEVRFNFLWPKLDIFCETNVSWKLILCQANKYDTRIATKWCKNVRYSDKIENNQCKQYNHCYHTNSNSMMTSCSDEYQTIFHTLIRTGMQATKGSLDMQVLLPDLYCDLVMFKPCNLKYPLASSDY